MSNNMNIKFTSNANRLSSSVNSLSKAMDGLGKAGRKTTGDFRSFQKQTRKLNDAFSNMARDGNRTTRVFKGMTLGSLKLNNVLGVLLSHRVGAWLRQGVKSAMEMIETNELFRVSLGNLTSETDTAIRSMSELTGLDTTNLRDRVANFNLLAKTMGMTAKNSQTLGLNMNQLALDMGAVFNVSYQQVAEDLRSGLVGQSRVLYKYGIDVTNAQLAEEARARGITKSVNKMSQYEKMMLRHQVILKQTTLIQGEFANEFNFPMNQLRLFQERFVTLSRTIGQLFLPAMGAIVRVANGVVIALTKIFNTIGAFFGIKMNEILEPRDGDFNPIDDESVENVDAIGSGLDKASKKAKKLKQHLMGFDELNVLNDPVEDSSGGGSGDLGGGLPLDFDLSMYDGMLDKIEDKAGEMADKIMDYLKGIWELAEPTRDALSKLWTEGLSKFADFSMGILGDFYNSFLVPVTSWQLGEGLPRFFTIINRMLKEIDWDRLRTSLNGLYIELGKLDIQVGRAILDFLEKVLKPIGVWTMGVGLPKFIDTIVRFLKDIDWGKINKSLNGLWDAITPFTINVGEGLLWFLDNAIRPLATIVINDIVPAFLDLLTTAIDALNKILIYFKPAFKWFMDEVLVPLGKWTGGVIVSTLEGVGKVIKFIGDNIEDIIPPLGIFMGLFTAGKFLAFIGEAGSVAGAFTGIGTALKGMTIGKVTSAFETLQITMMVAKDGAKILFDTIINEGKMFIDWGKDVAKFVVTGIKSFGEDLLLAKDKLVSFGIELGKSAIELGKQALEFVKLSAVKVWDTAKTVAMIVATKAWTAVTTVATAVGTAFGAVIAFLTSPIGLVIIAITALIAFGVLLYKNWDTVMENANKLWETIKIAFDYISEKVSEVWDNVKQWGIETWESVVDTFKDVGTWFSERFTEAWDNIVEAFSTIKQWSIDRWEDIVSIFKVVATWFSDMFLQAWKNIVYAFKGIGKWASDRWKDVTDIFKVVSVWFSDRFKEGWKSITETFKNIGKWATDRWKDVKDGFKNVSTWFGDTFSDAWASLTRPFNKAKEWASGVWGSIKSGFSNVTGWFSDTFSGAGSAISSSLEGVNGGSRGMSFTPLNSTMQSMSSIPMLAKGGVLDMGQMFIAREAGAELVGNFGNKTGVMNNQQIVQAVSQGVYQAVASAMSISKAGSSQQNEVALYINSKEVARALLLDMDNEAQRLGYKTILRYE